MENKLSPMMKHYMELKKDYKDTIILYRLGDFYEMFFDDAIEASKILDLTLTGRDCGLGERAPMCGVPYHAVDNYISKLISENKKVAICEQLSSPNDQKGMVKRDIVKVVTPGTVTSENMLDQTKNNFIASVVNKNNDYSLAYLDITTGEFNYREFINCGIDDLEDYLLNIAPSEIVVSNKMHAILKKLPTVISGKLNNITLYYDYAFDYDNAKNTIKKQFHIFDIDAVGLNDKFLSICAIGGLLDYVIGTQKQNLEHINKVTYIADNQTMYLDYNTQRNLELVQTQIDNQKYGSLLWLLDKTQTGMGARKLRNWILNPLQDVEKIIGRQKGVLELYQKLVLRKNINQYLKKIKDIERLTSKISLYSINPKDCVALRDSLKQIDEIKKQLENNAKSDILRAINISLLPLENVSKRITNTLKDEQPNTTKDGGYIKEGFNEELDTLRSLKFGSTQILTNFINKQREITDIPTLKVGYNKVFGYYIEITKGKIPEILPENYIRKQTLTNAERYTCTELDEIERQILGANDRILELESNIFATLKQYLGGYIAKLQQNANTIAILDCLCSLSEVALSNGYICPKFHNKNEINIQDGKHPVVNYLLKNNEFVPNDTILNKDNSTLIITGPNMAGKSTYIKQVALIVLMAHIGSFVPAKKAELCLVDRIFTRVGASDNLARGQSTFMVEMLEVANILKNATSKSLLILDEIGRGTSTLDGLSIAWAIVEQIVLKLHSKTLFATHFHELSELENLIDGIANYRILVQENKKGIVFLYKIARGGANKSFGIEVADIAGVNKEVTKRAKDILKTLSKTHELSGDLKDKLSQNPSDSAIIGNQISLFNEDKRLVEIKKILASIDVNRCTPIESLTILNDLKKIME